MLYSAQRPPQRGDAYNLVVDDGAEGVWVDLAPDGTFTRHAEVRTQPPVKFPEYVNIYLGDLTCICGNNASGTGFYPCLDNGTVVAPDNKGGWLGVLLACGDCGRIINQDTREVIGRDDPDRIMNQAADVNGWD